MEPIYVIGSSTLFFVFGRVLLKSTGNSESQGIRDFQDKIRGNDRIRNKKEAEKSTPH
jgi:hypothetical protein